MVNNELRRTALMGQFGEDDDPLAPKNTGISGGMPVLGAPPLAPSEPAPLAADPAPAAAPFQRNNTRLMEGNADKLANVDHAKKSPKYDFLQLANQGKYGYDQLGDMLGELQKGPNARHWQGWTADKDKLKFAGDPSQLGSEWGGVTTVDTIGGFNSGNPQGFRWGADDPNAQQQGGAAAGGGGQMPGDLAMQALSQIPKFGGQQVDSSLEGDPLAAIQAALSKMSGGAPNLQALLAQLGQ